jgi:hypothetical protein
MHEYALFGAFSVHVGRRSERAEVGPPTRIRRVAEAGAGAAARVRVHLYAGAVEMGCGGKYEQRRGMLLSPAANRFQLKVTKDELANGRPAAIGQQMRTASIPRGPLPTRLARHLSCSFPRACRFMKIILNPFYLVCGLRLMTCPLPLPRVASHRCPCRTNRVLALVLSLIRDDPFWLIPLYFAPETLTMYHTANS